MHANCFSSSCAASVVSSLMVRTTWTSSTSGAHVRTVCTRVGDTVLPGSKRSFGSEHWSWWRVNFPE